MKNLRLALATLGVLLLGSPASALANGTLVEFDKLPDGTPVQTGLDGLPVLGNFEAAGVFLGSNPGDHPAVVAKYAADFGQGEQEHVGLASYDGFAGRVEPKSLDITVRFSSGKRLVRFDGMTSHQALPVVAPTPLLDDATGTLTALDKNGNVVASQQQTFARGSTRLQRIIHPKTGQVSLTSFEVMVPTRFEIEDAGATIAEIRFSCTRGDEPCAEILDNLYFEGEPDGGFQDLPLSLSLHDPLDGDQIFDGSVHFDATIVGSGIIPTAQIDVTSLDTANGSPLVQTHSFPLKAVGRSGASLDASVDGLTLGRHTIRVSVRNEAGATAEATVRITNFPLSFVDLEGKYGAFKYGAKRKDCLLAVFERGIVAHRGSPLKDIPVPKEIADKWFEVKSPILGDASLGCPNSDVMAPISGWKVQGFEGGRIYVNPAKAALWVPAVVVDGIASVTRTIAWRAEDVAEEFTHVGWPVADPVYHLDTENPTWVFQRFARDHRGPAYQNTIEVRGRSPVRHVEVIGGNLGEYKKAGKDFVVNDKTPTLWWSAPCQGRHANGFPAACADPKDREKHDSILAFRSNDGHEACGGEYNLGFNGVAHWVSAAGESLGQERQGPGSRRPFWGVVRQSSGGNNPGSHLAAGDDPLTHLTCNGALSAEVLVVHSPPRLVGGIIVTAIKCLTVFFCEDAIEDEIDYWKNGRMCRSDWNLHLRPLYDGVSTRLLSDSNVPEMSFEIEWEIDWGRYVFDRGPPAAGDLVYVHGRHIYDCGHKYGVEGTNRSAFNAEIHPPDELAFLRSRVDHSGYRATVARVWVNSLFRGMRDSFTIYAPPRPSPTAEIAIYHKLPGYLLQHKMEVAVTPTNEGARLDVANFQPYQLGMSDMGQVYYPMSSDRPEHLDEYKVVWEERR